MEQLKVSKENSIMLTEESKKLNEELKKVACYEDYPYRCVIKLEKDDEKFYNVIKKLKKFRFTYNEYKERLMKRFFQIADDSNMDFFDTDDCLIAKKGYEKEFNELKEAKEALNFHISSCDEILSLTELTMSKFEKTMNKL